MRLLLDTHTFLWWVDEADRLSRRARRVIAEPENECLLSLASCWEMAIKQSLGKLRVARPLERFISEELSSNGFRLLGIDFRHVVRVATMPFHHRDPFDRLLVAQASESSLSIVTRDPVFRDYAVKLIW